MARKGNGYGAKRSIRSDTAYRLVIELVVIARTQGQLSPAYYRLPIPATGDK